MNKHSILSLPPSPLPADDLRRSFALVRPNQDQSMTHLGLMGDTYTVLLTGNDTDGRYCLIDMHVPPGGGPGPHRHDFEETFMVLEGELATTFRGHALTMSAGHTVHIPANAPHQFHNSSDKPARMLCICSPSGQEKFFEELGVRVP